MHDDIIVVSSQAQSYLHACTAVAMNYPSVGNSGGTEYLCVGGGRGLMSKFILKFGYRVLICVDMYSPVLCFPSGISAVFSLPVGQDVRGDWFLSTGNMPSASRQLHFI